jgi:hypothetical protein
VLRPATLLERVVQEEDAAVAAMVAAEEKAA